MDAINRCHLYYGLDKSPNGCKFQVSTVTEHRQEDGCREKRSSRGFDSWWGCRKARPLAADTVWRTLSPAASRTTLGHALNCDMTTGRGHGTSRSGAKVSPWAIRPGSVAPQISSPRSERSRRPSAPICRQDWPGGDEMLGELPVPRRASNETRCWIRGTTSNNRSRYWKCDHVARRTRERRQWFLW
jgi:hypothetical protein